MSKLLRGGGGLGGGALPSLLPRAIIPDARPFGTLKIRIPVTVRRGISKRSHEKIGDCEQSSHPSTLGNFLFLMSTIRQFFVRTFNSKVCLAQGGSGRGVTLETKTGIAGERRKFSLEDVVIRLKAIKGNYFL